MDEAPRNRTALLRQPARLEPHLKSMPINMLVKVPGAPIDSFDFIRAIVVDADQPCVILSGS
jgi:biotin synthase